jgi:chemotaxis protein histidine kinase CheA
MSLIILNQKTIIEAKRVINQIINTRLESGYQYPTNLKQCDQVKFKFKTVINCETLTPIESFHVEWLILKSNDSITEFIKQERDNSDYDDAENDRVNEKREFEHYARNTMISYFASKQINYSLLEYCLNAYLSCVEKIYDMTMTVKTDFIKNPKETKPINFDRIKDQPSVEDEFRFVYYETDHDFTNKLFEQFTCICFGKQMNKLGCEYTLLWQHCYKNVFNLFSDDYLEDDYYYSQEEIEEQEAQPEELESTKTKSKREKTTKEVPSHITLKQRLLKQPNMNKIKVRTQKYKELANLMKQYMIFEEEKHGNLVHHFKSPCLLQCLECHYDVKSKNFTFIYSYEKKHYSLTMDPVEGHIMIQHYSNKIVQFMD